MLCCMPAFAQSSSGYVQSYFKRIHQNKTTEGEVAGKLKQMDVGTLCQHVYPYLNDSLSIIRLSAYRLLHERGMQSTKQRDRQEIVLHLLHGWFDDDTGINGLVASCLATYAKSDFTSSAKDSIGLLLGKQTGYYDKLLRTAGFLDMTMLIPVLQQKLTDKLIAGERERWAAYLALSRMGDNNATQFVLNKVKALGVNDDVAYTLLPDLVYTRQRAAIDYLIEQLYSDEKNCHSPNAERSQTIPCAYRIMEYLAKAIKDYPLQTDASGELIVDNYEHALQVVRNWMKTRSDRYIIDDEHF